MVKKGRLNKGIADSNFREDRRVKPIPESDRGRKPGVEVVPGRRGVA